MNNSQQIDGNDYLLSIYYLTNPVLNHVIISFTPHNILGNRHCYYTHFTGEKTEA